MTFEIRVNNKKFTLWETAVVQRSIDMNTGKFKFTSTSHTPADYPVKSGDSVQIIIDGESKITGFVDVISSRGSKEGGDVITVMGRDNVADIIDSSVPDVVKNITAPISMERFCEQVIFSLGASIGVDNNVSGLTDFGEEVEITADSGRKCMDYLTDFARKKQVYLVTDGNGKLIIFRPSDKKSSSKIIHEKDGVHNNVKSYSLNIDDSERYNFYRVTSQDNFGSDDSADYASDGVDRKGNSIDEQIRDARYLEVQAEETMDNTETIDRAEEQNNIRRARGWEYVVEVVGSKQLNGDVWDFGLLVPIKDTVAGVNGIYLIRSVEYSVDLSGGTVTTLTFARPEAYTVRGEITQQDARIAPNMGQYQSATPPAQSTGFNRGNIIL